MVVNTISMQWQGDCRNGLEFTYRNRFGYLKKKKKKHTFNTPERLQGFSDLHLGNMTDTATQFLCRI